MKSLYSTLTLALASTLTAQGGNSYSGGDLFNVISTNAGDHCHLSDDFLGFDITRGWFDSPGAHDHSTNGGTGRSRYIHPLTVEAAFNDNDFFFDYVFSSFDDEDEHEIEIEIEIALTRRLGIVFETAFEFENEEGSTNEGFADFAVAARFVLVEFNNFISTANLEFEIPTGDSDFSSNELVLSPGLLTWFDLGNGFTLNTAIGLEIGTQSEEFEFSFEGALIKDFGGPVALTLESRNTVGLRDEERGEVTSEATLGGIYRFSNSTAIRLGWSFPISSDEFNGGAIASFNYSF